MVYAPDYNLYYELITGGLNTGIQIFPVTTAHGLRDTSIWLKNNINQNESLLFLGSLQTFNFYTEGRYNFTHFQHIPNQAAYNLTEFLKLNYSYLIIQIVFRKTLTTETLDYIYANSPLIAEITSYGTTVVWIYNIKP